MKFLKRLLLSLLTLFVIVATVLFSLQNSTVVEVDLMFGRVQAGLAVWLVGSLVLGILLGMLACTGLLVRLLRTQRRGNKQAKAFEKELAKVAPASGGSV